MLSVIEREVVYLYIPLEYSTYHVIFKFRNLELKIFYLALGDFGFLNRAVVDRQSEGTNVEADVRIKIF
jgi:hypothetical protein